MYVSGVKKEGERETAAGGPVSRKAGVRGQKPQNPGLPLYVSVLVQQRTAQGPQGATLQTRFRRLHFVFMVQYMLNVIRHIHREKRE